MHKLPAEIWLKLLSVRSQIATAKQMQQERVLWHSCAIAAFCILL